MRRFALPFTIIACLLFFICTFTLVQADELEDLNKKLSELENSLKSSQSATQINEKNLADLNVQLNSIKTQVQQIEKDIDEKTGDIEEGEKRLIKQKKLLDERVVSFYKNKGKEKDALLQVLVSNNLPRFLQQFTYQQNLLDEDRKVIVRIVMLVKEIEEKKAVLESEKERLIPIKEQIDKQSSFLAGEVLNAKKYQESLKKEIASLSARQKEIVAQKQSSLNIPKSIGTGASGCVDDRNVDPGFSPRFAFFTFGAPNRVGLSQYGAKGRAESGQNAEQILQAYFDNYELKKDYDTNIQISVDGYGNYSIEDYMKRVYEIYESWPLETLKAQVVAARSYALAYTNNGQKSICTTQTCQVFKSEPKTGNWARAVDETKGWVMLHGGKPVSAYFSISHGGYVYKTEEIGWNATGWTKHNLDASGGVSSFGDLMNNAYDKSSPWFYCDWGSRAQYNKTAWLKPDEIADIANVILLAKRDSSVGENLYQPDKPNPAGKETWNQEKVKSELKNRGGTPFNSISDINISADFGAGRSTTISISGDGGSQSFSASEWRDWFNLRAPANLQIVGPLFNIEKR